jgi:hypothetical protein
MPSEIVQGVLQLIEAEVQSRPTPFEFELAYQARIAIDRIKFAIKHAEQFGPGTDQMREAALQLLDALQRLETVDRHFQERSRVSRRPHATKLAPGRESSKREAARQNVRANGHSNATD